MDFFYRSTLRQRLLLIMPYALSIASPATALNLSQFQEIQGFSQVCTTAYNTPIPGCTSNDFKGNNACSSTCASGILSIQSLINQACKGTAADQKTLIGLFFLNKGVSALCPSVSDEPPAASSPPPAKTTQAPSSTSSADEADATESSDTSTSDPTTTLSSMARPAPTASSSSTGIIFAPTESAPTISSTAPAAAAASNNPNSFGGDIDPFASPATRTVNNLLGITLSVSLCIGALFVA